MDAVRLLGELLEAIHRASVRPGDLSAKYRVLRHPDRLAAAVGAGVRAAGGSTTEVQRSGTASKQPEEEEIRIWRNSAGGARVERRTPDGRLTYVAVRRGEVWWQWNAEAGELSNAGNPDLASDIGWELQTALDPSITLSALRFEPTAASTRAGRETISARATPRLEHVGIVPLVVLRELGLGATVYEMEVDREWGMLLEVKASRSGELVQSIEALQIDVGSLVQPTLFEFRSPPSEGPASV